MHPQPKKRLGQHFLIDANIQRKLISALCLNRKDSVLEIGAGTGELTMQIAKRAGFVYAVEIDRRLCGILEAHLKKAKNIELLCKDILTLDLAGISKKSGNKKLKVVGNIPYNISSPIMSRLFKFKGSIETVFITVQKEFAERILAQPGARDFSALSCFVQYYALPKKLFLIKRNSFFPAPEVDSCLLELKMRPKGLLSLQKEKRLFAIIRQAFNQRRKTLRKSLKNILGSKTLELFFSRYAIDRNIRPEDLSLTDFINLSRIKN